MSTSPKFSSSLPLRILHFMKIRHPYPVFSGQMSLEVSCSLKMIEGIIKELENFELIRIANDDERLARGMKKEHDVYVLTELGCKIPNKE